MVPQTAYTHQGNTHTDLSSMRELKYGMEMMKACTKLSEGTKNRMAVLPLWVMSETCPRVLFSSMQAILPTKEL